MTHRLFFIALFLMGGLFALKAQDIPVKQSGTEFKADTPRTAQKSHGLLSEDDLSRILKKIQVDDSLIYNLKDDPYAASIDSLWMREFTEPSLYDSIVNMVMEQDYNGVEFLPLSTDTLKKRLAALDARTPFNVEYNTSLESVIKMYLKRHRPTMERLMGLSSFYFPSFEAALDKHDIPLEMKYLAIVESALRPRARSRVGATGMWQFMYHTGKMYDLDVDSYVDERMDPIKSTEAACAYLSRLYEMFGDWDLALASYNSGPGNVSKAIRRSNGKKNYWNLRHHLPRETAGYVPAFLATMYIFEYAEEHGYKPTKPAFNYFETDTVHIKETITLEQVAAYTNVPLEEVQFLNPTYKLDIIPKVKDDRYYLRLPIRAVGKFVTNEGAIYASAAADLETREKTVKNTVAASTSRTTYRVRSGDYLGRIATRYGVGVSQLKRWNNLRSNNLSVGQRLVIYPKNSKVSAQKSTSKKVVTTGKRTYVVQKGDSLWKIAQKFPGVSSTNLKKWNDISGTRLKPGMTLVVSD